MIRVNEVLNSFAECGYDYTQPMTIEQLDKVQMHCFNKTKGEITYGKFHAALYMAGIKIQIAKAKAKKEKQGNRKPVAMIDDSGNVIMQFDSVKDAADFIDRHPVTISNALAKNTRCGGYRWEYVKNVNGL